MARIKNTKTFPKDQLHTHEQMKYSYPMTTVDGCMGLKAAVTCMDNKGTGNKVKSDNYVFHGHEVTTLDVIHHTLENGRKSGRRLGKNEDCK
jgi:hypothetical protein